MAMKELPDQTKETVQGIKREELECDLIFAGFLVAYCPLKPDSKALI